MTHHDWWVYGWALDSAAPLFAHCCTDWWWMMSPVQHGSAVIWELLASFVYNWRTWRCRPSLLFQLRQQTDSFKTWNIVSWDVLKLFCCKFMPQSHPNRMTVNINSRSAMCRRQPFLTPVSHLCLSSRYLTDLHQIGFFFFFLVSGVMVECDCRILLLFKSCKCCGRQARLGP